MTDVAKEVQESISKIEEKVQTNDAGIGGSVICPRCHFDTRKSKIEIDETDKQEYIRCLLGGKPFSKTYKALDNKVKFTFRDLSNKELDKIIDMVSGLMKDPLLLQKATKLKFLYSIKSFSIGDDEKTIVDKPDTLEASLARYDEIFGSLPPGIIALATRYFNIFNDLISAIPMTGVDENF